MKNCRPFDNCAARRQQRTFHVTPPKRISKGKVAGLLMTRLRSSDGTQPNSRTPVPTGKGQSTSAILRETDRDGFSGNSPRCRVSKSFVQENVVQVAQINAISFARQNSKTDCNTPLHVTKTGETRLRLSRRECIHYVEAKLFLTERRSRSHRGTYLSVNSGERHTYPA